jgi:hypothetical protein
MKRECFEKSCLYHAECEQYFADEYVTDFKRSKTASGEVLCVFHWGLGFMRAMKRCSASSDRAEAQSANS